MEELLKRLDNYPGAHPGEKWKMDTDLSHCTLKERAAMKKLGVTVEQFAEAGLNRGQVSHILFGYKYTV